MIILSILSSVLYVFSFAPWSSQIPALSLLQWVAFIPLFYGLSKHTLSYKKTFLMGFIMSLGIALGGFYWIVYATQQYGGLPLWVALLVFAAFCLISQLQIPIYLVLRKKALERYSLKQWILFSGLVYAGIESLYPKLFLDSAGNAFIDSLYIAQLADIAGVFLITTLVIIFAESMAYLFTLHRKERVRAGLIPALILIFSFSYGFFRVSQIRGLMNERSESSSLKVAMVQANIGDFLKLEAERGNSEASNTVIQSYLHLSSDAMANHVDAIIWPETAYPALFGKPTRASEQRMEDHLRSFASNFSGTMIFGGYDQNSEYSDFNAIFFLNSWDSTPGMPEHPQVPAYRKTILLWFGETLPFIDSFPELKSYFPTMGFFGRGQGPSLFPVPNAKGERFKLAPQICYEGLFPSFSAESALLGADAMVNVTNDSWFGPYGEPYLHLALTRFRSIETRVPMLRSTNTGITTHINELGELEKKTPLFESLNLETEIHPHLETRTPYLMMASVLGGSWYERLCQILTALLMITLWTSKKKKKSRN